MIGALVLRDELQNLAAVRFSELLRLKKSLFQELLIRGYSSSLKSS